VAHQEMGAGVVPLATTPRGIRFAIPLPS